MTDVQLEELKAALSFLVAFSVLLFGWFVGQRITLSWNLRQKRRELVLENLHQFYALYGEFKETSKLWRLAKGGQAADAAIPSEIKWSLLARACAIEGKNEAIIVKLASEHLLSKEEPAKIGLFRQAIQTLRESIRDGKDIGSASVGAEYVFVNALASEVACIISSHQEEADLLLADSER